MPENCHWTEVGRLYIYIYIYAMVCLNTCYDSEGYVFGLGCFCLVLSLSQVVFHLREWQQVYLIN